MSRDLVQSDSLEAAWSVHLRWGIGFDIMLFTHASFGLDVGEQLENLILLFVLTSQKYSCAPYEAIYNSP